eukprot:snap_masked-scaffold_21-processed-gene-4.20-mRNA-1 protein AED:0.20 eAED:1.00 QI:0/0/0/1/1/1/2/0/303
MASIVHLPKNQINNKIISYYGIGNRHEELQITLRKTHTVKDLELAVRETEKETKLMNTYYMLINLCEHHFKADFISIIQEITAKFPLLSEITFKQIPSARALNLVSKYFLDRKIKASIGFYFDTFADIKNISLVLLPNVPNTITKSFEENNTCGKLIVNNTFQNLQKVSKFISSSSSFNLTKLDVSLTEWSPQDIVYFWLTLANSKHNFKLSCLKIDIYNIKLSYIFPTLKFINSLSYLKEFVWLGFNQPFVYDTIFIRQLILLKNSAYLFKSFGTYYFPNLNKYLYLSKLTKTISTKNKTMG